MAMTMEMAMKMARENGAENGTWKTSYLASMALTDFMKQFADLPECDQDEIRRAWYAGLETHEGRGSNWTGD